MPIGTEIRMRLQERPYRVLKELAVLQQRPMTHIIAELIDTALPALEQIVPALHAVREAKGNSLARLAAAMTKIETSVEKMATHAREQADWVHEDSKKVRRKLRAKQKAQETRRHAG